MCCFCCCGHALIAGIITAILSMTLMAASIMGLLAGDCFFNEAIMETGDEIGIFIISLFYSVYFRSECETPINVQAKGISIIFPSEVPTAERTKPILLAYAILYGIWLCTSTLLLFGADRSTKVNRAKTFFIYFPWIIVTSGILLFDIATSILYGIDIQNSWNLKSFTDLTGSQVQGSFPSDFEPFFIVPALIMTLLFSKLILFWVIIFAYYCCVFQEFFTKMKKPKNVVSLETRGYPNRSFVREEPPDEISVSDTDSSVTTTRMSSHKDVTFYSGTTHSVKSWENYNPNSDFEMQADRDPRYERYLQNLKKNQEQEVRAQFPWSYIKGGGQYPQNVLKNYEGGTPSQSQYMASTKY